MIFSENLNSLIGKEKEKKESIPSFLKVQEVEILWEKRSQLHHQTY